ncbi:DNA adenine methylase [Klebsiella pneumoniae]|nr:DNA adenine methylase [Klebsiella pneumoniae]
MSKPFLKWAGGKYTQLADLFVHIPAGKRLIEPFVGGGAVFLNSDKHADYLLADVNPDLINLYQMLAVVPDEVELKARWMFEHMRSPDGYELIRSEFNAQTLDATERAAAFLYLNRHCFNGLMRYNQANKFNVGWGGYKAPYYPMDEMKAFAAMAHNCVFMTADYRRTISLAGKGECGLLRSTVRTDAGNNRIHRLRRWWFQLGEPGRPGEAMCICLSPWGSGSDF